MSLKDARRIAKRERKAGRKPIICNNRKACDEHNPNRHKMSGDCVVIVNGEFVWE